MGIMVVLIWASDIWASLYLNIFGVAVFFGVVVLAFRLLLQTRLMQALYAGSLFSLSIYSNRSIFAGIFSLALQQTVDQVLKNPSYYYTILALAIFLSGLLWVLIRRYVADDKKVKQLLANTEQLRFVFISHMILAMFLLLINDGRSWELRRSWYTILFLFSGLVSKGTSLFVFHHALRVSVLLEYERHTRQIQEQLARQLRHYQAYQKFTESFRMFKHDYKHLMSSVKGLIRSNENEKALRLIDDIHDSMQKTVMVHKTYSNNHLLDAVFQDAANVCAEEQIRFSAQLPFPKDVALGDLNTVRIATNIVNNAIEACLKVPGYQRFVEISGNYTENWIVVCVVNSYDGVLTYHGGKLRTTKKDKDLHGLGMGIIEEIIEDLGGLVLIDTDTEKKVFSIKLHIPRVSLKQDGP